MVGKIVRVLRRMLSYPWNAMLAVFARLRFIGRPIHVHSSSWIALRSELRSDGGGTITIGKNCDIHPLSMLLAYGGDIRIGDNCSVNPFTILYGHGGLHIGNGVRIATQVVIIPANHNPASESASLHESGVVAKGIRIDDDVWIGAGARILDGVHIGARAIVGAGSVVTRSVEAGATVAGVPARVIKRR